MEFHSFLVLLFSTSLLSFVTIGSTLNDLSVEDTVTHLRQKIAHVEERLSSIENKETSDLIQKLSMAVREAEKRILDDKNQLLGRMEEMEMEAKDARKDLSAKLHEMEERESKREEEIVKRVSEVEMRCGDISARLQNAEDRFLTMDTRLLREVQRAQEKSAEAIESVRAAKQEVESALESKTDIFQVKMNETLNYFVASHRDTENVIRKNISSSTEKLIHLNNSLSSRLDSLATKMRIFEENYANISFVSKLDQSLKNLDNSMKTGIQSIESQISPRVKELEERCTQCENVTELNKTLRNLTSQIAALKTDLLDIHTSHRDTENVIRKNISSSTEKLIHLNNSLSSRLDSLATKMRIFEEDYANISFVSKLDQSLKNLEKTTKTDIQSLESQLSPRVKELEVRCTQSENVTELNLRNLTSQIVALNTDLLDIQTSHRDTENVIRRNISSTTEKLIHLNNSLSSRLDSLATKVRIFEEDYANISSVSKLDQSLKNLEKTMKTDIQSLEFQLSPRVKELEVRCTQSENVTELNLRNLTSQIAALNTDLLDIQIRLFSCDGDPPALPNGKAIDFDRKPGSKVPYECDESYVLTSRSTVHCNRGHWEGQPPVCSYFDATFHLRTRILIPVIECFSAFNLQKITFSRVLDTGSGTRLGGRVDVGTTVASLDFHGSIYLEEYGSFQCGFSDERGSMNIAVQRQNRRGGIYFEDHSKVANIGDDVDLEVRFHKDRSIGWRHNGVDVPSWRNRGRVEIPSVQPSDAGIYECNYEGDRSIRAPALLRLIVRKCKKNLFGEHCDQQCPPCYNGGICHDHLGVCVCPPGFVGNNCEVACLSGNESPNCRNYSDDRLYVHCLPDPYGCSCARGWKGRYCSIECENGWYGAECKQPCHCVLGTADCDVYTGVCPGGCSPGWTGQSCQIEVVD